MALIVHCPDCQRTLRVGLGAAGKEAKCPSCGHLFIVPKPRNLYESVKPAAPRHADAVTKARSSIVPQSEELSMGSGPERPVLISPRGDPTSDESPAEVRTTPDLDDAEDLEFESQPESLEAPPPQLEVSEHRPEPDSSLELPALESIGQEDRKGDYPPSLQQLQQDTKTPRLIVIKCTTGGVELGFDSSCLNQKGFRASMPPRCVFSGRDNRAELLVRPLVFGNQFNAPEISIGQIESNFEQRSIGQQSTRELIKRMGLIDGMRKPFNQMVPYYVNSHYTARSLRCTTRVRSDGGITCQILIPNGQCALEWLGRVNGVSGQDYFILEKDIEQTSSDAWTQLPELTRTRIAAWCFFESREQFVCYLSDADIPSRDAGLGGLVATNRRLAFQKYQHHAEVALSDKALLLVQYENNMASVTLRTATTKTSMGKFRRAEVQKLVEIVDGSPGLRIEVSE